MRILLKQPSICHYRHSTFKPAATNLLPSEHCMSSSKTWMGRKFWKRLPLGVGRERTRSRQGIIQLLQTLAVSWAIKIDRNLSQSGFLLSRLMAEAPKVPARTMLVA